MLFVMEKAQEDVVMVKVKQRGQVTRSSDEKADS